MDLMDFIRDAMFESVVRQLFGEDNVPQTRVWLVVHNSLLVYLSCMQHSFGYVFYTPSQLEVQCILGYLNQPRLSDTSIIQHLDYPNANISLAIPTFTKATWVMVIAKSCKMMFSNCQSAENVLIIKESWIYASSWLQIDLYKALQKQTIDYSRKFSKKLADMLLKIGVQPKLDEHCIFWGQQRSEKTMVVTRLMLGQDSALF